MATEDLSIPVVICLAAGPSQRPVIERARALGFFVIGVDRNPEAASRDLCDFMIHLSTHEPAPLIQTLKSSGYGERIVAVLNRSSGPPVLTAAAINAAFALPGLPVQRARQCLNKDLMREECLRQNLSVVGHQVVLKYSELDIDEISYPCVVKPALSMIGKKGVMVVERLEDLENAYDLARASSVTGKVLVEEYLPGFDVSVIAFVNHGELEILAILDEINQKHDDGSVCGRAMAVPSRFSIRPEAESIIELTRKVMTVFELQHSPLLISCRITEGGQARLMEIHLDMGGDKILDVLLPAAGPFDAMEFMIKAQAGQVELGKNPEWTPAAVIFDQGEDLITNRSHRIIRADSINKLQNEIANAMGEVSRP